MKKQFILVSALAVCAIAALCATSCKKDDGDTTCTCTEYDKYDGTNYGTKQISTSSYGAANCSDLALKLSVQANQYGDDAYVECH